MKNAISWFELPATDLDRAQKFYEAILDIKMIPLESPHIRMRMFPIEDPMTGIGGALALAQGIYNPSATEGPIVYLNNCGKSQTSWQQIDPNPKPIKKTKIISVLMACSRDPALASAVPRPVATRYNLLGPSVVSWSEAGECSPGGSRLRR